MTFSFIREVRVPRLNLNGISYISYLHACLMSKYYGQKESNGQFAGSIGVRSLKKSAK